MKKSNYRIFLTLVFTVIFAITLSVIISYIRLSIQKNNLAKENLYKIDRILSMNFEEVEKILIFIGNKIASDTPQLDLNVIYKVFVQTANISNSSNIFSWSLFDWVNNEGYEVVNTMYGIRKDPPNIALNRTYLHRANKPWTMMLSEVAIGNPSGIKIIPIGVQIETTKYPRAGAVTAGLSVQKIANIIEPRLDKNIDYAILDNKDGKFIMGSRNFEQYFKRHSTINEFSKENYEIFAKEMMEKYPYKILVKYNKRQFWREVFLSSLLLSTQIIGAAMVMIFIRKII